MLSAILFIIVGFWLEAPWWYFLLCGVLFLAGLIRHEINMMKSESDDE